MSSVLTATVPVLAAPVATALVAAYVGRFGSGVRLRRELKEDLELLGSTSLAGPAATELQGTVERRTRQLVAMTRYPRMTAAELPALILVLTSVAVLPASYLIVREGRQQWSDLAGLAALIWLGIPVGAAWLFLGTTLPARARRRLCYLQQLDRTLDDVREDAEVVGLWAWLGGFAFYASVSCWSGQLAFLGLALGRGGETQSAHVLAWSIGLSFLATGVLFEFVTATVTRHLDNNLWDGLEVPKPGVANRLRAFRGAARTVHLRWGGISEAPTKPVDERGA